MKIESYFNLDPCTVRSPFACLQNEIKILNEIEGEPQLEQKDIINYVNSFHIFAAQQKLQQNSIQKLFCPFSVRLIAFYHLAKLKNSA